jgi:SAM-dependent methyltransferase
MADQPNARRRRSPSGVTDSDAKPYAGSAHHYRRGRPPYSPELEATFVRELGLDGHGRLLDVGCGPGILTLRLAPLFKEAIGLDPDADMLGEARAAAEPAGVANVRWVRARAEDLPDAAPGPYRLVTFGQSFHWTDKRRVADAVYDLLEPGGAMATVVHMVDGRPRPDPPSHPPIPHDELRSLVVKYLGSLELSAKPAAARDDRFEDVLAESRFGASRTVYAPGVPDLLRDVESVISGYLSTSFSAPHLYGGRLDEFVAEARALLDARSPDRLFWDWPGDTVILLAEKLRSRSNRVATSRGR